MIPPHNQSSVCRRQYQLPQRSFCGRVFQGGGGLRRIAREAFWPDSSQTENSCDSASRIADNYDKGFQRDVSLNPTAALRQCDSLQYQAIFNHLRLHVTTTGRVAPSLHYGQHCKNPVMELEINLQKSALHYAVRTIIALTHD